MKGDGEQNREERRGARARSPLTRASTLLSRAAALWVVATLIVSCPERESPYRATIRRDVNGVAHVQGERIADVLYGMGYAMAQDQIDAVVFAYRTANGRLAAHEGAGDSFSNVISDYLALLFRVPQTAEAAYSRFSPQEREWLNGFIGGVNAYVAEYNADRGASIERFTPQDLVAWGIYLTFARQLPHAVAELQEEAAFDFGFAEKHLAARETASSNQWAVRPPKCDGPAIVYGDPHLPWEGVTQWYEVHLCADEADLDVTGAAAIGAPFVAIGRNRFVAWTLTSNTPSLDFADVYRERLMTPHLLRDYRYDPEPGGSKVIVRQVAEITVKDLPFPVTIPIYYTHHGPVFPLGVDGLSPVFTQDGLHVYSIAMATFESDLYTYPGEHASGLLKLLFRLDTAQSVEDILLALGLQGHPRSFPEEDALQLPKYNVTAGDVHGDILYLYNGRCPVRNDPAWSDPERYARPLEGWTGLAEWKRDRNGRVEFWAIRDLPKVLNPACGYVVNCNAAPWRVCPDSGIDPKAYPPYLVRDMSSVRQIRARELFDESGRLDTDDLRRIGMDVHLFGADLFEAHLLSFFDPAQYPDLAGAVGLLASEPNEATRDNRSVLLLLEWFVQLGDAILEFPLETERLTDEQQRLLIDKLRLARDTLAQCPLGVAPAWGEVHFIERGGRLAADGGLGFLDTLYHVSGAYTGCGGVSASQGSSFMQLTSLGPGGVRSWSLRPLGASNDPASAHYRDETERFVARDPETSYKYNPFDEEELRGAVVESITRLGSPQVGR